MCNVVNKLISTLFLITTMAMPVPAVSGGATQRNERSKAMHAQAAKHTQMRARANQVPGDQFSVLNVIKHADTRVADPSLSLEDLTANQGQMPAPGPSLQAQVWRGLRHTLVAVMVIADPTQLAMGMRVPSDGLFQPARAEMGAGAMSIGQSAEAWPLALSAATCPLVVSALTCPLAVPADTEPPSPSTEPQHLAVDAMGRGTVSGPAGNLRYGFRIGNAGGRASGFLTFDIGQTGFTFSGTPRTVEVLEVGDEGAPQVIQFAGVSSNRDGVEFHCILVAPAESDAEHRRGWISLSWRGGPMDGDLPLSPVDEGYMSIERVEADAPAGR